MQRIIIVSTLLAACALAAFAATEARKAVLIGSSLEDAVQFLGTPASATDLGEGRVILFYAKGQVSVQDGKVLKWKGFPPPAHSGKGTPLAPGAARAAVLAALGWPCAAYPVPMSGTQCTKETWEYQAASLTFVNDRLAGWVNAADAGISLGEKTAGAAPLTIGSSRQQAIAALGTPDDLDTTADGYERWHLGADLLLLRAGRVVGWENFTHSLPLRPVQRASRGAGTRRGRRAKRSAGSIGPAARHRTLCKAHDAVLLCTHGAHIE